jgi:hypothetical protein
MHIFAFLKKINGTEITYHARNSRQLSIGFKANAGAIFKTERECKLKT